MRSINRKENQLLDNLYFNDTVKDVIKLVTNNSNSSASKKKSMLAWKYKKTIVTTLSKWWGWIKWVNGNKKYSLPSGHCIIKLFTASTIDLSVPKQPEVHPT